MARRLDEAERQSGAAMASHALARQGSEFCLDCGDRILAGRRFAVPSATRCAFCQRQYEGMGR